MGAKIPQKLRGCGGGGIGEGWLTNRSLVVVVDDIVEGREVKG